MVNGEEDYGVMLHPRQDIIILICGLELGVKFSSIGTEEKGMLFLTWEHSFQRMTQLFKTKLLPLLKVRKLKEKGTLLDFTLHFFLLSKLLHVFSNVVLLVYFSFRICALLLSSTVSFSPLFLFGKNNQLSFEK